MEYNPSVINHGCYGLQEYLHSLDGASHSREEQVQRLLATLITTRENLQAATDSPCIPL